MPAALAEAYLAEVLDGEQAAAEALVTHALMEGVSVTDVYAAVISPALAAVGRMWELDGLSIADEHMASEITAAIARRVLAPTHAAHGPLAVVACGDDEGHALGAQAVASALGEGGWKVAYLGAQVPAATLERFVSVRRPALVALSVKLPDKLLAVAAQVRGLRRLTPAPKVLVGGRAVTNCALDLGADHVGDDLDAAVRWARREAWPLSRAV